MQRIGIAVIHSSEGKISKAARLSSSAQPDLDRVANAGADLVLVYGSSAFSYELKQRAPGQRVAVYFNTLAGFCTDLSAQRNACWLSCSHLDRLRHYRGGTRARIRYLLHGNRDLQYAARGFRALDACLFDSVPLRDAILGFYQLPAERCLVVPECIDFEAIAAQSRPHPEPGGPLEVLYAGTLYDHKGIGLLFESLRRVKAPWRVWIFGDGPDRPRVLAFQEEFPDQVEFRGHVENRRLFAELAARPFVFVHPCLWFEAFGRSIVEAMALAIPVVVPDVGGPGWIVTDGVDGVHYRHRNAEHLAERIEWVAAHPAATMTLAAKGRERAREFHHGIVVPQWRAAVESLIGKTIVGPGRID